MSLKDHITSEKPPNPMTGDKRRKSDQRSNDKKSSNPDGKLKRKIGTLLKKRYFEKKFVDKKPSDSREFLREKPMPYD